MSIVRIRSAVTDEQAIFGIVLAMGVRPAPATPALDREIERWLGAGRVPSDDVFSAVRDLLRRGGFKPSGRNKPAAEYLVQAARDGRFPCINNLVDISNLLSAESGLPISLLDLEAFDTAPTEASAGGGLLAGPRTDHACPSRAEVLLRCGMPGESYVFNQAGQVLDLRGLLCVCRAPHDSADHGVPLGSAVKDSLRGKIGEGTRGVVAVVYAVPALRETLEALCRRMADLLALHAEASSTRVAVLAGGAPRQLDIVTDGARA